MRKATASPMYKVRSLVAMPLSCSLGSVITGRSLDTARLGLQSPEEHGRLFISLPWQYRPPFVGVGFEQCRLLTWCELLVKLQKQVFSVHRWKLLVNLKCLLEPGGSLGCKLPMIPKKPKHRVHQGTATVGIY